MATVQSEVGRIRLFEDFFTGVSKTDVAANTTTQEYYPLGPFKVYGQGMTEIDSGCPCSSTTLNGLGDLVTTDEDNHCTVIGTGGLCFTAEKSGTIIMETRLQFADLDTKEVFFGLQDVDSATLNLEGTVIHGATATITLTASDLCGFLLSAELTDDEDWHAVYNGGTTVGETVSDNLDLDCDAVVGDFQILRLEVDPNGTARWFVDGVLKKTLAGAVDVDEPMTAVLAIEAKTTECQHVYVDYLLVDANRDWTV